ncbi:MAG: hypothetical protein JJU00_07710 [Opitutales bacterium]|nr:hypothetical protein [Opitutales bacterium]
MISKDGYPEFYTIHLSPPPEPPPGDEKKKPPQYVAGAFSFYVALATLSYSYAIALLIGLLFVAVCL